MRTHIFSTAVITFVLLEIIARSLGFGQPPIVLLDKNIEYYLKPSSSYERFGNTIDINRYGMRSIDFDKNDQTNKIFLFGDSVVYGTHRLDQNEILGSILNDKLRQNTKWDGIVASIAASSWGPENISQYYKKFGPFTGQYAVIVMSSHDRADIPFRKAVAIPARSKKNVLAVQDIFIAIINKLKSSNRTAYQTTDINIDFNKTNKSIHDLVNSLKPQFEQIILVFHATKNESLDREFFPTYYKTVANDLDIHFINTRSSYGSSYTSEKEIHLDSIHLSQYGADHLANLIYEKITSISQNQ